MANAKQNGENDGIEIHCDEDRGYLSLACEPDAFKRFRQFVASELRDFPELRLEKIVTIEINDTARHVARRESPRNYWLAAFAIGGFLFLASALGIGMVQIAVWLFNMFSN